ncbi:MAG: hypothetical protein LUD72_05250 [Bacteroidales bacterium]|nr:hypothetical protein [Bacteroidales bacterium]
MYKNRDFYEKEHKFPLFEFPTTYDIDEQYYIRYNKPGYDAQKRKEFDGLHFTAPSSTPKSVCEEFFAYVAKIVEKFLRDFCQEFKSSKNLFNRPDIKYTLLYAPKIAKQKGLEGEYDIDVLTSEYKRLVMRGFGIKSDVNVKLQSSAKALAMMASESGNIEKGSSALIFDIGEEFVSVVKAGVDRIDGKDVAAVDSLAGHSDPVKIGGNDIDKAIGESLEAVLESKENIGDVSYGESGRTQERGLKSKNYLFLKSIKSAKSVLSAKDAEKCYPKGVPVSVVRDVEVFKNITTESVCRSIGIENGRISGDKVGGDYKIAKKLSDYVLSELKDYESSDRDVKKIYLCGGVAGTCGFISAVRKEVEKIRPELEVRDFIECFSNIRPSDSVYAVRERDMYSFAAAVGGAILSLYGVDIRLVLTKTFATVFDWNDPRVPQKRKSHFSILVDRGTDLEFENNPNLSEDGRYLEFKLKNLVVEEPVTSKSLMVYSTNITSEDIRNCYKEGERKGAYVVSYHPSPDGSGKYLFMPYGNPLNLNDQGAMDDEREARALREIFGIDRVIDDASLSQICMYYRDKSHPVTASLSFTHPLNKTQVRRGRVVCFYGVRIDKEGNVTPFVENDMSRSEKEFICVEYTDRGKTCRTGVIKATEIFLDFRSDKFKFSTPM